MYVPVNPLAKGILRRRGCGAPQAKGFEAKEALRGEYGCFRLTENLLVQVWKENHSALIFPNKQKEFEQLGPSPPTTLSNNDESLMFLPRFTKEQWLTQNYSRRKLPNLNCDAGFSTISFPW